ncbi:alpha-L-fucosidase-like [Gigantopelta aegis]|uniref:alpha-L-fucosidase-like n=1 Tax=Gigantopelta aegis TaxID=1735272 RepID=UPI001B88E5AB|nr:alpha-L-fucosidase-like [Gigantopelta aegis]
MSTAGVCLWLAVCVLTSLEISAIRYEPNWKSLDSRPIPSWYDEAKIGIFLHWGVFSVPSYLTAWFVEYWVKNNTEIVDFMKNNYRPGFTYADFASQFTAEFYDPVQWANLFEASGARYVVLTTKHHEGFCNWKTKYSWNWNSVDVGPKRDLVGDLVTAIRKYTSLKFGTYHSLFEFINPLFLQDQANNFTTQDFVRSKTMPELYELINNYKPDLLWSDGEWMAPYQYWNATQFLAWLYNDSPVKDYIVTNDRWGENTMCKHGGFYTCHDKYNPKTLQKKKFEDATTFDKRSWTYRRRINAEDLQTPEEIVTTIAEVVSCGGNVLINAGPTSDGRITPIFQERMLQMGQWLKVNGEAIYSTRPWIYQNDTTTPGVWYTSKKSATGTDVYAIVLSWPTGENLVLGSPEPDNQHTTVSLLGYTGEFGFKPGQYSGMVIKIPPIPFNKMPCQWGWVFKLQGLKNM